jgi:glycosyltransferase involved in cell wall biosynthesis
VYDPGIIVDHFPGPRFDADRRGRPDRRAIEDASYNLVASLLAAHPELFLRRAVYGLLIGDGGNPGLARGGAGVVRRESEIVRRLAPSLAGQARALTDFARDRRLEMTPLAEDATSPAKRAAPSPERPTKVVFTIPWGERLGGAENMLFTLLRDVDRRSVEPIVVFLVDGPFRAELAGQGIRTIVLPAGRLRNVPAAVRAVRSLAHVLRRERPQLLVNWMSKTQLYGAPAAALAGMGNRVVWWQHGIPNGHWMDRLATALPARAVGCSSRSAAAAQELLRPRRRTFVIHPGIELPSPVKTDDRSRLRREVGLPADAAVVGIVGRLQPWKGHDRFIRALSLLCERGVPVHGLVVGGDAHGRSPGYRESLERLVDELGLSGAVTFAGHVSDATPYISVMEVMISASSEEPFGLVILEAMAVGTPVVAVDAAGPSEIIEPDKTGVLVPTNDEHALADAVETLLADPARRTRLSEAARHRLTTRFTAARTTDQFVETVNRLCNDRTRLLQRS